MPSQVANLNPERISVVIPAYNAAWCIERALDSVLSQTQPATEIIVIDDGSQDNSAEIVAAYRVQHGDKIRLIQKQNKGLSAARNTGIHAASCDYVAFLDADDYWLSGKLAAQSALFKQQPELAFCSTAADVVDQNGSRLQQWTCPTSPTHPDVLSCILQQLAYVAGSGSAVMAPRHLLKQVGGFDPQLKALEDIDMWMRLACCGPYACVHSAETKIFRHRDSMSGDLNLMRQAALMVLTKNRGLLPTSKQGRFWQQCYAGTLIDYAKWAYRSQLKQQAQTDLLHALKLAPIKYGKLIGALFFAMAANKAI